MYKRAWGLSLLMAAVAGGACTGSIGERPTLEDPPKGPEAVDTPPVDDPVPPALGPCEGGFIGSSPARMLTPNEYDNTMRDLLGDTSRQGANLPSAGIVFGFDNNAYSESVSQVKAERYMEIAENLSRVAVENPAFLPCDPAAIGETECVQQLIETFGKKAYRRPLSQDEEDTLLEGFSAARRGGFTFKESVAVVVQIIFQSPQFLYRFDTGIPDSTADESLLKLTPYEVATRLSYMLWASTPDDELLAAADANLLETPEQIEVQARRMLGDYRAREGFRNFYRQWLGLDKLTGITKDPEMFPGFSDHLAASMRQETERFVDYVVWEMNGGIETLLTADFSILNTDMANHYGVEPPPKGVDWMVTQLDPAEHAGLLTQASWLTANAHSKQTSPVHRGLWIRNKMLCQELPPPPPNVVIVPPEVDPNSTTRERFAQHSKDPACSGCHSLMDPVGLGFEHHDPIGQWRMTEGNNLAVSGAGEVKGSEDVDGKFDGARDLADRLAQSTQVHNCIVTHLFRYSNGRGEETEDKCTIELLNDTFAQSNSIQELLVAMTQTEAFRYRVIPSLRQATGAKGE